MDISPGGAKLSADPEIVAPWFELYFVPYSHQFRVCKVVWRRGRMLGVKFMN
jgi:hypothetical protein